MEKKYICFLNGKVYGHGDLKYMQELFHDYVIDCKMYGLDEIDFKIIEKDKARGTLIKDSVKCNYEVLKKLNG